MPPWRHPSSRDEGFSMIEIMVAVAIVSALFGLAVVGWRSWALSEDQQGAADGLQSTLRNAQVRAVTEGVSFCVKFDTGANSYGVYRYACNDSPALVKGPMRPNDGRVHLKLPEFTAPDGTVHQGVTFLPRGSAWPGSVQVTRDGSTKVYTLKVEGFTGRVSTS